MDRSISQIELEGGFDVAVTRSLPELAYGWLRQAILSGKFDGDTPLRQEDLASQMGISRLPVREALNRLEAEGLVVQRPRRGFVVASLEPDEIEDIFEIRAMLEERAGYLATIRRTQQDVVEVEQLSREMEKITGTSAEDLDLYAQCNYAFHTRLFETCGRAHLCRTMIILRNTVERYVRLSVKVSANLDRAKAEHREIVEAFRRGDAPEVARLSRLHCETVCAHLLARLRDARHSGSAGDEHAPE